ncbi:Uncharacterised protein [Yersinia intermedia]|nr:Uncharacterised protein [Yersinia intermedia]CRF13367.1 Uncharacterised protein [Yersinia intermedia]
MAQAIALFFAFTGIYTRKDTDTGPFPDANTYPNIATRTFITATQTLTIFSTVQRNIIFGIQTKIFPCLQLAALYPNIARPLVSGGGDRKIIPGSNVAAAGGSLLKATF